MSHLMLEWQVSPTDATRQLLIILLCAQYPSSILVQQVSYLHDSTAGDSFGYQHSQCLTWTSGQ